MNTYTIRALTVEDAALVRLAGERLAAYYQREGMTQDNSLNGTWDITQAAKLAEHLRSALEIIERLTRPAATPEPPTVLDGETALFCYPEAARSRVERVTGTGWPA